MPVSSLAALGAACGEGWGGQEGGPLQEGADWGGPGGWWDAGMGTVAPCGSMRPVGRWVSWLLRQGHRRAPRRGWGRAQAHAAVLGPYCETPAPLSACVRKPPPCPRGRQGGQALGMEPWKEPPPRQAPAAGSTAAPGAGFSTKVMAQRGEGTQAGEEHARAAYRFARRPLRRASCGAAPCPAAGRGEVPLLLRGRLAARSAGRSDGTNLG